MQLEAQKIAFRVLEGHCDGQATPGHSTGDLQPFFLSLTALKMSLVDSDTHNSKIILKLEFLFFLSSGVFDN